MAFAAALLLLPLLLQLPASSGDHLRHRIWPPRFAPRMFTPQEWVDAGRVSPFGRSLFEVTLHLKENPGGLQQVKELAAQVSDPSGPRYGKYLTRDEINALVDSHSTGRVITWLATHKNIYSWAEGAAPAVVNTVLANMTAAALEGLCGCELHRFRLPASDPASDTNDDTTLGEQRGTMIVDAAERVSGSGGSGSGSGDGSGSGSSSGSGSDSGIGIGSGIGRGSMRRGTLGVGAATELAPFVERVTIRSIRSLSSEEEGAEG